MIFKFLGMSLVLLVSALLLRSFGWRGAPVFAVIASVFLLAEAGEGLAYIFESMNFSVYSSELEPPIKAALKIMGIGYLFGICADICRELGEGGIAKSVEIVGRVEIIAVVIPFLREIIKVGVELIE